MNFNRIALIILIGVAAALAYATPTISPTIAATTWAIWALSFARTIHNLRRRE